MPMPDAVPELESIAILDGDPERARHVLRALRGSSRPDGQEADLVLMGRTTEDLDRTLDALDERPR